jgi:hypothetical protein
MIALSISLLLTGTFLLVFLQTRMSYQGVAALSTIQDNGRFLSVFLNNIIKQANDFSIYNNNILLIKNKKYKNIYFISDTGRLNNHGKLIYALYEKKILPGMKTIRRELVPGVDRMDINLDSDFSKSLVINLYLNSINPLSSGLLPFIYTDNSYSFFDKNFVLHRKWPVYITLKNMKKKV